MELLRPITLGRRTAPNRVLFGPHETNLGRGRALSERHVAYYRERAVGGAGVIVVEEASVHPSDWPYERCPAAAEAGPGWSAIVEACADTDALLLAALGHSGGQGSSAFNQRELWAPSDEPEVNTREVPKVMEPEDVEAVVDGFAASARAAVAAGLAGVEINAGQHSLIRQFLSGLTNRRADAFGSDRSLFARTVLDAVRAATSHDGVVGLRLSCDELAPWAGVTPESAAEIAADLAPLVDFIVVVRGSIFSVAETRPTGHHGTGFNLDLAASISAAVGGAIPVFAQGSIVDPADAEAAISAGRCDGVEMTRALIADPGLVAEVAAGRRPRPCVLCNQRCRVRDNRNPIVSCIVEPRAGYETIDPPMMSAATEPPGRAGPLLVVGAGPAGLEAARVAARARPGREVTVVDRATVAGGLLRTIARAPGQARFDELADWLVDDAVSNGVTLRLGEEATPELIAGWDGPVILATGARRGEPAFACDGAATILGPEQVLALDGDELDTAVPRTVAVWDPIGNSVGVAMAELLAGRGRSVTLVTPDAVAGSLLSLTGDLAGANVRLQQAGVAIERRRVLRRASAGSITIEHQFTAEIEELEVDAVVDCSGRVPDDQLWLATGLGIRAGDAVAPRTVGEAIREGRAAALDLDHDLRPRSVALR